MAAINSYPHTFFTSESTTGTVGTITWDTKTTDWGVGQEKEMTPEEVGYQVRKLIAKYQNGSITQNELMGDVYALEEFDCIRRIQEKGGSIEVYYSDGRCGRYHTGIVFAQEYEIEKEEGRTLSSLKKVFKARRRVV